MDICIRYCASPPTFCFYSNPAFFCSEWKDNPHNGPFFLRNIGFIYSGLEMHVLQCPGPFNHLLRALTSHCFHFNTVLAAATAAFGIKSGLTVWGQISPTRGNDVNPNSNSLTYCFFMTGWKICMRSEAKCIFAVCSDLHKPFFWCLHNFSINRQDNTLTPEHLSPRHLRYSC